MVFDSIAIEYGGAVVRGTSRFQVSVEGAPVASDPGFAGRETEARGIPGLGRGTVEVERSCGKGLAAAVGRPADR